MKKLIFAALIIMILSLTGCMQEYKLSEKGTEIAAEYMAGLLLKEDKDYKQSLISIEDLADMDASGSEETGSVIPSPAPDGESDDKDGGKTDSGKDAKTTETDYTLSEVIGAEGFDIQYEGYRLYNSYPDDETASYFTVSPRPGNQLLVISFRVKNTSGEKKRIDLSKSKVSYQLDINVGTIYKPQLALLENDLQFIDMPIKAEGVKPAVLIYEVPKDIDMTDINLIISKDSKTEIIKVK